MQHRTPSPNTQSGSCFGQLPAPCFCGWRHSGVSEIANANYGIVRATGVRPEGAEPPASREAGTPKGAQPSGCGCGGWARTKNKAAASRLGGWRFALSSTMKPRQSTSHNNDTGVATAEKPFLLLC